ncbi:hypothetical protein ETD86_23670 [Nonomuraea turkmeniaca]|uniref:Uncharacterized protein n=1 Tax=Nonomuraea turkmeniaca TaxID=103838 RepID=A0A5S4FF19_9ACTN|nr:hypothetical protein [Nonomuraea turkmeniaca]TMR17335.1 hypothetical protein ETD86_23670 [Nonomuraea turkmeniaca]
MSSWRPPQPMGYLDSIQAVGGFAAPLLAGASFTLAVLALQSPQPPAVPYSRWPDAALVCFVLAGLAQIATVQATAWTRRYMCTPEELGQWYPEHVTNEQPSTWLRNVQESHLRQALRWADATRLFFHCGVLALLLGVVVACVPDGEIGPGRWAVLAVGGAGVVGELSWLVRAIFLSAALRRQVWLNAGVLLAAAGAVASAVWAGEGWALRTALALLLVLVAMMYTRLARRGTPSPAPRRSLLSRAGHLAAAVGALVGAAVLAVWGWPVVVACALLPVTAVAFADLVRLVREQRALRAGT